MAKEVDQQQHFPLCLCPPTSLLAFFNNLHLLFCFSNLQFFLCLSFTLSMDKHHSHLPLAKCSRQQQYSEWVFRDVPIDIVIVVNGGTFSLHKFPLVSRSGRIQKLVAGHRDSDISMVGLLSLPGGAESFELAAKFFYGVDFEITAANVAELCCVSDYLEMTEEYSKNNLGSRAEEHLEVVVSKNLEMCVEVLKQCENLFSLADELKIVTRCIDAIASKACVEQIASSFSRLEYSSSGGVLEVRWRGWCKVVDWIV